MKGTGKGDGPPREDRLKAALRENLRRRKAQARARRDAEPGTPAPGTPAAGKARDDG